MSKDLYTCVRFRTRCMAPTKATERASPAASSRQHWERQVALLALLKSSTVGGDALLTSPTGTATSPEASPTEMSRSCISWAEAAPALSSLMMLGLVMTVMVSSPPRKGVTRRSEVEVEEALSFCVLDFFVVADE